MSETPTIAIQLLLYKSSGRLKMWLESIKQQTWNDWKLFVQDNSVDPEEAARIEAILKESGVLYEFTASEENGGFAAHNQLFSRHDAPYAFLVNDDVLLDADYLERLMAVFESDPSCGAATGLVMRWDKNEIQDPKTQATIIDSAGLEYRALGSVGDRFAGVPREQIKTSLDHAHKVFGVSCAAALFKTEAIETSASDKLPFDPAFFMYKEDVDLAIRLERRGYASYCEPKTRAYHERTIRPAQGAWQRIKDERKRPIKIRLQTYQNQWALYAYHFSWRLGFRDVFYTAIQEVKRSGALFVLGSPIAFIRAWARILTHIPYLIRRRKHLHDLGLPHVRLRNRV